MENGGLRELAYQKMKEMNGGKQMKDVWTGSLTKPSEKKKASILHKSQNTCWKKLCWHLRRKDRLYWTLSVVLELLGWRLYDLDGSLLE